MMRSYWFIALGLGLSLALPAGATDVHLPTPFSAEQIRDAWPLGLRVVTRYTTPEGGSTSVTRVVEWSQKGMTTEDQTVDAAGAAMGEPARSRATWAELRDHARFSADRAERQRAQRSTPLGTFDGWLYTVTQDDLRSVFFFADTAPGPPLIYHQERGDEMIFTAEVLERETPAAPSAE